MAYSKEHLSKMMRVKRAERNWTQGELAEHVGVSKDTITAWEAGRVDPGFPQLCKMADAFECSAQEFTVPQSAA